MVTLPKAHKRFVEAWEALSRIRDGSVVVISGFNMSLTPEYLIMGLYQLYRSSGHPKDLFIISDTFPGSPGRGLDWVAERLYKEEGESQEFIRGMLVAYYGWSKWLQKMIVEEHMEAYTGPSVFSRTGLGMLVLVSLALLAGLGLGLSLIPGRMVGR